MKKVIVITGGNSGLGKATAKILANKHRVIVLGKNVKELEKTSKELKCDGMVCEVTSREEIENTFSKIIKKYKKVDCLINCAGVWAFGPIEKHSEAEIKDVIMVNTVGTMLTTGVVVPQMKKQKSGRIINVVSQAGLQGRAERSLYNASKWAVTGFTKSLQLELSPFNISVVGFYPGFIETGIFKKAKDYRADFSTAMKVIQPAKALAYLVDVDSDLVIKSFEIESIKSIK